MHHRTTFAEQNDAILAHARQREATIRLTLCNGRNWTRKGLAPIIFRRS
jgi:hypothetical protein